jgi:hypothetical protein
LLRNIHDHVLVHPLQCLTERGIEIGCGEFGRMRANATLIGGQGSGKGVEIVDDDTIRNGVAGVVSQVDEWSREGTDRLRGDAGADQWLAPLVVGEMPGVYRIWIGDDLDSVVWPVGGA